ncbi:MAG: hypothetical protein AAGF31_08930 [Planctomycetota bacterium]
MNPRPCGSVFGAEQVNLWASCIHREMRVLIVLSGDHTIDEQPDQQPYPDQPL